MPTYERRRHLETHTVKDLDMGQGEGAWASIHTTGSTGFMTPAEHGKHLTPGTVFELELTNGSTITGIRVAGAWLYRKSDEDLDEEHRVMVEGFDRDRREQLAKHRDAWQARQDALPEWIRARIEGFHVTGGENFALEGWGYELVVAELAVAYLASGGADDDAVNTIAREQGTSGNQHECAKHLAWVVVQQPGIFKDFPSALTPLTGDYDYSKGTK
ncbi:hypothetical protein [Cryobacterium cryoconiti]|uniref:Uncharacterized protein n=1 Tax=Cryobacterium cryoconiti TaxID=1259239 RepID=A0A4Y8JSJ2_9MICO|nr:hypothetical protein [Cryobacterium cryoconiti]TFD27490.1 hypothetical protein E3T49_13175 [Cryobacterium cryoconiti]